MKRKYVAQKLIQKLNEKVNSQLNLQDTLILGVVLKGLPVAYCLARINGLIENFVPIVAQRSLPMQHHVESYFLSSEWQTHLHKQLKHCETTLIVDDIVNTGFTKQRVETTISSLINRKNTLRFAALILNCKILANPNFISSNDIFALKINAKEVECDWGLAKIPLWDLSIEETLKRCEGYFQKLWLNEKRFITVTY